MGGLELARRIRASNSEREELREPLDRLCRELEGERELLVDLFERHGISRSKIKPIGAWIGEKFARLKLNGRLRGYSPLGRILELEGLLMGISGKRELWRTLGATLGNEPGFDFAALVAQAEAQRASVEELHQLAVALLKQA